MFAKLSITAMVPFGEVVMKDKKVPVKMLSDFASGLMQRTQVAQGKMRETCKLCGFKVRGLGHKRGKHHALRHPSMKMKPC